MADANDDALAATALALNEDAKAGRKKKAATSRAKPLSQALDESRAHLGTGERWFEGTLEAGFSFDADGYVVDEDGTRTGARRKPAEETLTDAVASLGAALAAKPEAGTEGYDLSEGAHNAAMQRMETMATEAVLSDRSLIADTRDFLLDQIKARPKPWSGTSNGEQRDVAAACEHAGTELIRKIVEALATAGRQDPVRILLTKVTLGDTIVIAGKAKAADSSDEDRVVGVLHRSIGKHVMLTVASVDDYRGEARDAVTDPDQHGLGFEAGLDGDHHEDDD